jgi:hypothetical protein
MAKHCRFADTPIDASAKTYSPTEMFGNIMVAFRR